MKKILQIMFVLCCAFAISNAQLPGSGNALMFDGVDDQVDLGTSISYQNFTIDMWVKPGASQTTYADIIDNNHTDYQNWVCQQDGNNTNKYYFGCSRSTGGINSHFSLITNVWQHITLIKKPASIETYVNGVLAESAPWSGTVNFRDQFLRLGNWGSGGRNWKGSMDEIRIWNIPLTQSQLRERMCRKISSADPLHNNLVAYYNLDENELYVVFDGTVQHADGNLVNGTARTISGAAIGNASTYNYVSSGLPAVNLGFNGQDSIRIAYTSGTYTGEAGSHVYVVNEKPNTVNGFNAISNNDRYFGVFSANLVAPAYTVGYNYSGNPYATSVDKINLKLFKRIDNSTMSWSNGNAIQDTVANTLTATGQNTEYILGLPCEGITANITADGPLNFCQGGCVTLTSNEAESYLWSNGATTQSITVNVTGSYSVTVSNAEGCRATSNTVSVSISSCFPQPVSQWQKSFGGSATDRAYSIQPTSDGGYIVAGQSSSNDGDFTGNHGGIDYRVIKLDPAGNIVWEKNYGGGGDDIAKCVRQTSEGGYIVVGTSTSEDGDILNSGRIPGGGPAGWVLKLDNTGNKLWGKVLQGWWYGRHSNENRPAPCNINTVIETSDSGYLLGGDYYEGNWLGDGGTESMLAKLDPNGEINKVPYLLESTVTSIVETSTGYTATGLAGYDRYHSNIFVISYNFAIQNPSYFEYGGSLDEKATSIQKTADGGYIVAGTSNSTDGNLDGSGNHGDEDFWLLKLNNAYEVEWSKCFGGSGADMANAVQQMTDGSFSIAGTSFSSDGQATGNPVNDYATQPDAWIIHVDQAGNFIGGNKYGGTNPDEAFSLEKTTDGGLVMAGASSSTLPGSINKGMDDFWMLKLAKPAVANGVPGQCTGFPPVTINSSNNNQWVLITDNDGNVVAEIKANGNNLGVINSSAFVNSGPVREDAAGRLYLDRTITIKPQFPQRSPIDIRLYIKGTEYAALKNARNSFGQTAGINSINDLGIFKINNGCVAAINTVSNLINTTGSAWENDYVLSASINSFSSFCFASKMPCAAPVINNISASPASLSPANHQMRNIMVNYTATGNCGPVTSTLSVSSNETVNSSDAGDLSPDWIITDDHHVQLRAERLNSGQGRTYTITITSKSAYNRTCKKTVKVFVPATTASGKFNVEPAVAGNENNSPNCLVVPNPSGNFFELQVTAVSNEKIEAVLFDIEGRKLGSLPVSNNARLRFGEGLKSGVYLLKISQGYWQKTIKIIKQ